MTADEASRWECAIDAALAEWDFDQAEALVSTYRSEAESTPAHGPPARLPAFRAAYLAARVALDAGRLALAEERLVPLLPLTSQLPPKLACRLWLMSAESLARSRRPATSRTHLDRASSGVVAQHLDLRMRALRVRLWLGDIAALDSDLAHCSKALLRKGDPANAALLACEEGRAWDLAGDLDRAERCWRRAESLYRPFDPDPIRADVLAQLGRLAHLRGHFQDALDAYDEARTAAVSAQQREIGLRRLLVLLDLNQWEQARADFEELRAPPGTAPEETNALLATVVALLDDEPAAATPPGVAAYVAAAAGNAHVARGLYALELGEERAPARRARSLLALGLLALAAEDRTEAVRRLGQAEALARDLDLPEILWRALEGRGRLTAECDGDEEGARPLFEEALSIAELQANSLREPVAASSYRAHALDVRRQLLRAACRRGDPAAVFRHQELGRGQLLLRLWLSAPGAGLASPLPELDDLERRLKDCEGPGDNGETSAVRRQQLLRQRDRLLEEFLADRTRRGAPALPTLPDLAQFQAALPTNTIYVAPALTEDEVVLLVVRPDTGAGLVRTGIAPAALVAPLDRFRHLLGHQLDRYRLGFALGPSDRARLDDSLEELGEGPLGTALEEALDGEPRAGQRLLWVPDGLLHGLPVHALRRGGRYLIERRAVVSAFGGSLLVHRHKNGTGRRRWGGAVIVTERHGVLPQAAAEGDGVAASFLRRARLNGPAATRSALVARLRTARVAHFACHAYFDATHPLASSIGLPSGEIWRALEWLGGVADGLPLTTLSACRSAEVAPLAGGEVFGLVSGILGGGGGAVLAGLWPIADRETKPLMWRFYRERLTNDLAGALALAQRAALREPDASPLFWAAFALFGDADSLPRPGRLWAWLARWRQRRHARRFPTPDLESKGVRP